MSQKSGPCSNIDIDTLAGAMLNPCWQMDRAVNTDLLKVQIVLEEYLTVKGKMKAVSVLYHDYFGPRKDDDSSTIMANGFAYGAWP